MPAYSSLWPTDSRAPGLSLAPLPQATGLEALVLTSTDSIEMGLPPKPEYQSVLRATIGVIAGDMSFNYDEIIQLRVAVSEAFQMAIRQVPQEPRVSTGVRLVVRLTAEPDNLEIVIFKLQDYTSCSPHLGTNQHLPGNEETVESRALLESLMDEVEVGLEAAGEALIRMVKYKSAAANN